MSVSIKQTQIKFTTILIILYLILYYRMCLNISTKIDMDFLQILKYSLITNLAKNMIVFIILIIKSRLHIMLNQ